mmetsp:Transcript_11386/g.35987  ORF Transcript_11386/g.35987 Transcript_11386/m.35987 type:complete len:189 (-) Transcript_11386:339-905(-)
MGRGGEGGMRSSRSLSPVKRRRSPSKPWKPVAPFDPSSSISERVTLTYDVMSDPHLPEEYKSHITSRKGDELYQANTFTVENDRKEKLISSAKASQHVERRKQLERLYEGRVELFERIWTLWPDYFAYYPSIISAGGSELCPVKRRMQIEPPKNRVPNQSLLLTGRWVATTTPLPSRGNVATEHCKAR